MRLEDHWRAQRLCRDRRHGRFMGVCAGLADYLGWDVTVVRALAIIALLWFSGLTLIAYFALGFILPAAPESLGDRATGEPYWRSSGRWPDEAFGDVHHRVRVLEMKLQCMEGHAPSGRYNLAQQFRDLED